jgi:hypothetical protein
MDIYTQIEDEMLMTDDIAEKEELLLDLEDLSLLTD